MNSLTHTGLGANLGLFPDVQLDYCSDGGSRSKKTDEHKM